MEGAETCWNSEMFVESSGNTRDVLSWSSSSKLMKGD